MSPCDTDLLPPWPFVCLFCSICILTLSIKKKKSKGTWLAQSVEHPTLDLWVVSSSPMLGMVPT